jgi:hypothetical protein
MVKKLAILILVASSFAQAQLAAHWIAAPWSTERDGAETDGSKPMPIFRREFPVRDHLAKAELRIAGLGQFEARLGSQLVGRPGLHQAWTDYRKTVTYETYDVTSQLHTGMNVLGVMLGNGMYNVQKTKGRYTKFDGSFGAPRLIAELRLTYAGGKVETIATDEHWKSARGPITFDSTYGGEDFDARKQPAGWHEAGFRDADWNAVALVDGPEGKLIPAIAPEVLEAESLPAVSTRDLPGGKIVYDLGRNFAGVPTLRVHGPAGAVVKLTPGELLKPDGSVSQASSGGPMWWSYTLSGSPDGEVWQPQFGYYGFRYVQVELVGADPVAADFHINEVGGRALHSASPAAGSFESSNAMLNSIHALIVNAMHNNEASLFTDCPHREKLGWLEETHLVAPGLLYNNDLRGLFAATAHNMADAQLVDGDVPTIAPRYTKFGPAYAIYDDSPEWGSASVLATWTAYRFHGDKTELARNYPTMQRYVTFLQSKAVDGIVAYGLGDWYDIGPGPSGFSKLTTLGVTGTIMLYEDAAALEKIATLLGKSADAAKYRALAAAEKDAFNKRFYDVANGYYDKGSQTAQAMPLALGIVPEQVRAKVLAKLVADIEAHEDHTASGEVGFPYELRALTQAGRNDLVMRMMMRKDAPSYGSQLAAGATSLTEDWSAAPRASQDHFMLGAGEEWLYRAIVGIDVDMTRSGAAKITIRPAVVDGVDWVKGSYMSALGMVKAEWRREGANISLDVTAPVALTVELPGQRAEVIGPGTRRFTYAAISAAGR